MSLYREGHKPSNTAVTMWHANIYNMHTKIMNKNENLIIQLNLQIRGEYF